MSYSRSRTQQKKKSERRSRTRFLLYLNSILLVLIAGAVGAVWYGSGDHTGKPGNASTSPTAQEASSLPAALPTTVPSQSSGNPGASEPPAASEESSAPEQSSEPISISFVGDVLPAARVLELMKKNGYDYPFREAKSVLEAADITAGNLESPITLRGTGAQDKQYVFRGPKEALPAIKKAGFDFMSLANNHTLDYGQVGLSDTMEALDDVGLPHAGAGSDDREAFTPAYIDAKGVTVAFVAVTRVVPEVSWKADRANPGLAETYTPTRAVAAIKEAKKNADLVVVMVHWGEETKERPVKHQTYLAHTFVDAGADLVIGSHPHVLQGFESYNGKWIAYSLGNFVFSTTSTKSSETGVLTAECGKDGSCSMKFQPMFAKDSQPAPMAPEAGKLLLARLSGLSYGASVEEDGSIVAKN
jgi:poly-gamma-glutamate capsule biosynthesis protein CapA/YwtB (metallophosphatase superfamily)